MALMSGILSIVIAIIVFILADGYRRYYSGIFFVIIGGVLLLQTVRLRRNADQ